MTPGHMLGSKLTPGTLLHDYFKEPLVRLNISGGVRMWAVIPHE